MEREVVAAVVRRTVVHQPNAAGELGEKAHGAFWQVAAVGEVRESRAFFVGGAFALTRLDQDVPGTVTVHRQVADAACREKVRPGRLPVAGSNDGMACPGDRHKAQKDQDDDTGTGCR
jgi:hypothetical protein